MAKRMSLWIAVPLLILSVFLMPLDAGKKAKKGSEPEPATLMNDICPVWELEPNFYEAHQHDGSCNVEEVTYLVGNYAWPLDCGDPGCNPKVQHTPYPGLPHKAPLGVSPVRSFPPGHARKLAFASNPTYKLNHDGREFECWEINCLVKLDPFTGKRTFKQIYLAKEVDGTIDDLTELTPINGISPCYGGETKAFRAKVNWPGRGVVSILILHVKD